MRIEKLDKDNLIVFLNQFYINKINFEIKDDVEACFKNLFEKLNNYYHISIMGYYNINVYFNKTYGSIIEIKKEDFEYLDYFDNHVDMKVTISKYDKILFKLDNLCVIKNDILNYSYLIRYQNELYLLPKKTINQYQLGHLIENSSIVYGKCADNIISIGEYVNLKYVFV